MTITNERIKAIFLTHGFKEKPQEDGATDLNPYVYQAARALLAEAFIPHSEWREAVQEFVDRCERGEVRSVRTYARFKALLETALPNWPEDTDEYGRLAAIAQNGNDGLHYQDKALSKPIPTADQIRLVDAAIQPPPSGAAKLILLSRYGVTTVGTYQKGYHVAWAPMPKAPDSVKRQAEKEVAA